MGASTASGQIKTRRSRRTRRKPMSEINVTPFVDVMLVLLIIFMVAAPMLTVGVPVELPKTAANALPTEKEEPLTVTLTAEFDSGSEAFAFQNLVISQGGASGPVAFDMVNSASQNLNSFTNNAPPFSSDRKSTRLNSSHSQQSRMPSSA